MVIVTKNQYLVASKIFHITMDEQMSYEEVRINNRHATIQNKYFQISIVYAPETGAGSGNHTETRECTIIIRDVEIAHRVFQDMISQIREQMPDVLYLDKALERMLSNTDIPALVEKDNDDSAEIKAELSPTAQRRLKRFAKTMLKANKKSKSLKKKK